MIFNFVKLCINMSNTTSNNSLNIKQAIIDEGLYEDGMTFDDMEQIYKTLNRSKRTANEENEYRELLSQTDINCSNIELIKTEDIKTDDENEVSLSNKEIKNNSEDIENKEVTDDSIRFTKNIEFNFDTPSKFKTIAIEKHKKSIIPILYHQPFIRTLPVQKKIDIIKLYLRYEKKKISFNETNFVDQWGKPIIYVPKQGEDLLESRNQISKDTENICSQPEDRSNEKSMTLRSTRLLKRRNYKEVDSDDENSAVENKKTKLNIEVRKVSSPVQHSIRENLKTDENVQQEKVDSEFELSPIISKNKLNHSIVVNKTTPISKSGETSSKIQKWYSKPPNTSDRTNKMFDKLKEEENKNSISTGKKEDLANLSDSGEEEIFPIKTNLLEVTSKLKKGKNSVKKKLQPKSRKKLSLKSINNEQATNINTEVSTTNFYGKNKENELDASNNNKNCTSMIQCPICSQSFASDEVEDHAWRCEQYNDSTKDSLCAICNTYVENGETNAHKVCLKQITEESTEKSYDKNKNKSTSGFLCNVCDKYVVDCSQFEHASNCIATVDDG